MKIVAIVQARMGSTRLPGKVLLSLAGEPVLTRVVKRVRRARTLHEVVVATTVEPSDDLIVSFCHANEWPCLRGSEADVLDRYYQVARARSADVIVRITADCPLIDPGIIDAAVAAFFDPNALADYVSTELPSPTYPRGLDVEVFSSEALAQAWREDDNPVWREHVTPYMYRHPDLFRVKGIPLPQDLSHHRWTVDTAEDVELVRRIYLALGRDDFTWREVFDIVVANPSWPRINSHVLQKLV